MVTKPTKQQIEQGKLRAGGNNPVKVTKAGVKRLGQAALIAASFTPIGRTAKVAGIIAKPISKVIQARSVKNTKVVVEKIAKMQEKAKAEKIASNSVKVKPAAIKKDATKENFYEQIRNPIKINSSNSVKVKPAAKNKANPPDKAKIENKVGTSANRARAKGNDVRLITTGRKTKIQENKITNKKPLSTRQKTRQAQQQASYESGERSGYAAGHY